MATTCVFFPIFSLVLLQLATTIPHLRFKIITYTDSRQEDSQPKCGQEAALRCPIHDQPSRRTPKSCWQHSQIEKIGKRKKNLNYLHIHSWSFLNYFTKYFNSIFLYLQYQNRITITPSNFVISYIIYSIWCMYFSLRYYFTLIKTRGEV